MSNYFFLIVSSFKFEISLIVFELIRTIPCSFSFLRKFRDFISIFFGLFAQFNTPIKLHR